MKITLDFPKLLEIKNRPKHKFTLIDIYELYPRKDEISYEDFVLVCKTFNHLFIRSLIETGNIYRIPQKLGRLSIRKRKTVHKRKMNVIHYFLTGEKIFHNNRHSEGYYVRFHWEKKSPFMLINNKNMVKFTATRFHKRFLSQAIKERNTITKYYEHG